MVEGGKDLEGRLLLTLEQPNLFRFLDWGYDNEQPNNRVSLSARATGWLGERLPGRSACSLALRLG